MKNKYWSCIIIFLILIGLSMISIILNHFWNYKIGLLNLPLLFALIFYIIGLIFYFIANLKYLELESNNPIKALEFSHDYYDKVGYTLLTSGLVAMFNFSNYGSSIGLIIIGATLIIISQIKKEKVKNFNNTLKK